MSLDVQNGVIRMGASKRCGEGPSPLADGERTLIEVAGSGAAARKPVQYLAGRWLTVSPCDNTVSD